MMSAATLRQPNFAMLVAMAWLLVVLQLVVQYWPETGATLSDTDDAMRLVEMRGLLAGHGWFGLHEARVQPPLGYDPHWSRLIDAGLAGLYLLFEPFFGGALAERLMRTVWPMLWLIPAIAGVGAIAWRLAGREAALAVLLFAVIGLPAFQQFKPGRIDHHNVQIAIVLLTTAATVWAGRWRHAGMAAGALTGAGLAIGYEGAPLLIACGAALALRWIADPQRWRELRGYGLAIAGATALAFLVDVPPHRWAMAECDSIAFNTAIPVVAGGFGLALATLWRGGSATRRVILIAIVAAVAAVLLVLAEPRCLGGPYAMMDPQVKPIWLAHVSEMQPLLALVAERPLTAVGLATFPLVSVAAVALLALRRERRTDFAFLTASAVLLVSVVTMFAAIKAYCYAMWLGMPLVAMLALQACARLKLNTLVPRFIAVMLLTPMALSAGAMGIASAAGIDEAQTLNRSPEREACFETASYAALASLPPGLVVTEIDYGPFLLVLTPHAVMGAPYHRLSVGIVAAHRAFASPPEEARGILARLHATYVATCGPRSPSGLAGAAERASLWGQLQAGAAPDWLQPIPLPTTPFKLYRVAG